MPKLAPRGVWPGLTVWSPVWGERWGTDRYSYKLCVDTKFKGSTQKDMPKLKRSVFRKSLTGEKNLAFECKIVVLLMLKIANELSLRQRKSTYKNMCFN